MTLAKLFLGILLMQLVHLSAMGAVGVLSGARLKEASLGIGPVLFRLPFRGASIMIRPLPLSGYVQFWRRDAEPPAPPGTPLFEDLPAAKRAATYLAGVLALFVVGSALLGSIAWRPAIDGVIDLVRGAIAPRTTGAGLIGEIHAAATSLPIHTFFGLLFVKIAAWNALPIPPMNGGAALLDIAAPNINSRVRLAGSIVGTVLVLAGFVAWIVALATFLLR